MPLPACLITRQCKSFVTRCLPYVLAWAGSSRVRKWQANIGLIPPKEGQRLAREAVERALELSPNLAEAHAQMGRIKQ